MIKTDSRRRIVGRSIEKLYAKVGVVIITRKISDIKNLDNCMLYKYKGQYYILGISDFEDLIIRLGQNNLTNIRNSSQPIFDYFALMEKNKNIKPQLIVDGQKSDNTICSICKYKLAGLIGNCVLPTQETSYYSDTKRCHFIYNNSNDKRKTVPHFKPDLTGKTYIRPSCICRNLSRYSSPRLQDIKFKP